MRSVHLGLAVLLLATANLLATDIPRGAKITVRTSNAVSSNRSVFGDPVEAVLVNDLVVNGKVIAVSGALVHGVVSSADPSTSGKFSSPGSVAIRLETVETSEGTYHLSTNQYTRQGRGRSRSPLGDAGGSVSIGSVGGVQTQSPFPVPDPNGVSLGSSGPEAMIPANSVITFKTAAISKPSK